MRPLLTFFKYTDGLFIVQKIRRTSEKIFDIVAVYYCLDGTIYMGPGFADLLRSRVSKASYYMLQSFEAILGNSVFTADRGRQLTSSAATSSVDEEPSSNSVSGSSNKRKYISKHFPDMKTVFSDMQSETFWENF